MIKTSFPKKIEFSTRNFLGLTSDAQNFLAILKEKISLRMLSEYELEVIYPTNMVREVRIVDVDDIIFRLDFVDYAGYRWCVFPDVPWSNRAFFEERWSLCKRKVVTNGNIIISFNSQPS